MNLISGGESHSPFRAEGARRVVAAISAVAKWLGPIMGFLLIVAAVWVLQHQLRDYRYADIVAQVEAAAPSSVVLALLLAAGAYAVLVGYDLLALAYVGRRLPLRKIALGSFVAHAMSHSLGFHMITAGSIRYRFWSAWGLSNTEIAKALGFASTSFLFGMLLVCGVVLLFEPPDTMALLHLPAAPLRVVGALLVGGVFSFLLWMRLARRPLSIFGFEVMLPKARLAVGHLIIAASDWTVAASVAYVLLPAGHGIGLLTFTGVFLLALLIGAIGHVPGGVGVFETLVVLMLRPYLDPPQVLGSLILYRLIYYVVPFGIAMVLLLGHEVTRQGTRVARAATAAARWVPAVIPFALGTAVFAMGTVLLLSSATPLDADRMLAFGNVIPLGLIELSHFAASTLGAALLLLAWFIRRRLYRAYLLAAGALAAAAAASILRGLIWQVALMLLAVLLGLLLSRKLFSRTETLRMERLPTVWAAGVVTILALTVWLGVFTFKTVDYAGSLWIQVSAAGDVSRFLRATAGAIVFVAGVGASRLMHRAAEKFLPTAKASVTLPGPLSPEEYGAGNDPP